MCVTTEGYALNMSEVTPDSTDAPCPVCGGPHEQPSVLHAWSPCEACGNPVYTIPGPDGLRIEEGQSVTLPAGAIQFSLDRGLSSGTFSRVGVTWFVEQLMLQYKPTEPESLSGVLATMESGVEALLQNSDLLADLDLQVEGDAETAVERAMGQRNSKEFWAFGVMGFIRDLRGQIDANPDSVGAAAAALRLGLVQGMLVYISQLEPYVWQAYETTGIAAMKAVLSFWEENRDNSSEAIWQQLLNDYPFVLSQVLPHPIVVVGEKAYVGGKRIDNRGGQVTDFLLAQTVSSNVALLELKTPVTTLLGRKYRDGVYPPSRDLAGAISQVLSQRDSLVEERHLLDEQDLVAFSPACVVVAGRSDELDSAEKRRSFELYRAALGGVTVLTFDELFLNLRSILDALTKA